MDELSANGEQQEIRTLLGRVLSKLEEHDQRFDSVDQRIDSVDQRIDSVDQRIDSVDQRIDSVDQRIDEIHLDLTRIENEHGARLEALFDGQLLLIQRMDRQDERLEKLEAGQLQLEAGQAQIQRDVDTIRISVGQLQAIASNHEERLPRSGP
ncbi:MAG: hypothetical protein JXR96_05105 [Deltaproteobacteria bacterium]|nr:hypothetical protein [Deltaproteobacteria bacterium]